MVTRKLPSTPAPILRQLGSRLRPTPEGGYNLVAADLASAAETLVGMDAGGELLEAVLLLLEFAAFLDSKGGDAADVVRATLLAPGIDRLQALASQQAQLALRAREAAKTLEKQRAAANERRGPVDGLSAPRGLGVGLRNRKK